jgi:hypothetical protein
LEWILVKTGVMMRVKIRKPVSWFGPYQLANALCFWVPKVKDNFNLEDKPDWVHDFGTWLAGDKHDTWLTTFLTWYDKKRREFPWNKDTIKVEYFDTWSMDCTLSPIILPMLKQLKATKHGYGMVEDEDVPKHLRSIYALPKDPWEWDGNAEARYEWILDEMIWAFEQLCDDDSDSKFYDHSEARDPNDDLNTQISKMKVDRVGLQAHNDRIDHGLKLFGKYFRSLWD